MSNSTRQIEISLGADQVREWLIQRCKSEAGAEWVRKAQFSTKFGLVRQWHAQVREMMTLISSGDVPNRQFYDLENYLIQVRAEGTFLEGSDYLLVANSVEGLSQWLEYLKHSEDLKELPTLASDITLDAALVSEIRRCIDENGDVRSSASPQLSAIRKRIGEAEKAARSVLHKFLKKSVSDETSPEGSQVTLRDGRLVLPVKAEFKRTISGLIHDESSTGQTVFLEPSEALELNNEVRELKNEERREVIRILTSLADSLRRQLPDLQKGSKLLAKLDFIHAKAIWAREFEAIVPELRKSPSLEMYHAVHPVLWKNHKEANKKIVPLTLKIDDHQKIIVVSGPNAGGKSVALKTVGLLQYLVQCGIPVPAVEPSVFGIFDKILLDIGDPQSLEDDLSTYSAHLGAMRRFVDQAGKKTLVLIDEFGKGTEPQFGGAIAEAILEHLAGTCCYGLITTHFQNLKNLADRTHGMVNAAMKYDVDQLEPLFELEVGKPGSSFAFEIAGKMGLPKKVLQLAKSKMGEGKVDFDRSLNQLEKEKQRYSKLKQRLEKEEQSVAQLKKDYEALKSLLDEERKSVLKEARQQARQILQDANKQVENTIREIRESQAEKNKTRTLREGLKNKQENLSEKPAAKTRKPSAIKVGDRVQLDDQEGIGLVTRVMPNEAEVEFGLLKSFVKKERLKRVGVPDPKPSSETGKMGGINRMDKMAHFSHEVTIRGMRVEEALPKIDHFVDEAILVGADQVKVVHGKGHGVLRDVLRNHLRDHPHIAKIEDEHADRGGSGISIVTLK